MPHLCTQMTLVAFILVKARMYLTGGHEVANASESDGLVKSKQRVADHGEVFTPSWMVQDMLNLVQEESERIDSRVLEPACGAGNFLVAVVEAETDHCGHSVWQQ